MASFPDDYPTVAAVLERVLDAGGDSEDSAARRFDRLIEAGCLPPAYLYAHRTDRPLPPSAREAWKRHLMRQSIYRREVGRLLAAVEPLPVAVLKGEPLSWQLFDDGRARQSADLDLIVLPDDVGRAIEVARELGYRSQYDHPVDPAATNQWRGLHRRHEAMLEIHWRLDFPDVPTPPTRELLARATIVDCDGLDVPALSLPDACLAVAYKFHRDFGSLKALLDAAAFVDRHGPPIEHVDVVERARALNAESLTDWPLETLRLFSSHDPGPRLAPDRAVTELFGRLAARLLEREFVDLAPPGPIARLLRSHPALFGFGRQLRRAASLVMFSDWHEHPERALHPLLFGRSRIGRCARGLLRQLGREPPTVYGPSEWPDRDAFEQNGSS
ncbi:MAG: nucleotidyltransferase family protein [Bradymonadaceae bacterium]